MKTVSKVLALILAIAMIACVMAACGGSKQEEPADNGVDITQATENNSDDSNTTAVPGKSDTWGEITVFVPDSMNMKGGNGAYDPDDTKTLWLYDNANAANYIKVSIVDSEDNAKLNVESTKEFNSESSPTDIEINAGDKTWIGVTYDYSGTPCITAYCVSGDKVYFIMEAGYAYGDSTLTAVLASLS